MRTIVGVCLALTAALCAALPAEAEEISPLSGQYVGNIAGAEGPVKLSLLQDGDWAHGWIEARVDGETVRGIILGKRAGDRVILWFLAGDDLVLDLNVEGGRLVGSFVDGWPDTNGDQILTFEEARNHFDDAATQKEIRERLPVSAVIFSRIGSKDK